MDIFFFSQLWTRPRSRTRTRPSGFPLLQMPHDLRTPDGASTWLDWRWIMKSKETEGAVHAKRRFRIGATNGRKCLGSRKVPWQQMLGIQASEPDGWS